MAIFYLEDNLKRLRGGEWDRDEVMRELEEENAELKYQMNENEARIEEVRMSPFSYHGLGIGSPGFTST
jgi:hypothetical protein